MRVGNVSKIIAIIESNRSLLARDEADSFIAEQFRFVRAKYEWRAKKIIHFTNVASPAKPKKQEA